MRKNKKLLLAGVAAMGALALGVGATSTFAWYQASSLSGAIKSVTDDSMDLTVSDPHYTAETVDLPLNIRVATASENSLELAHYYAAGDLNTKNRAEGGTWVTSGGDDSSTFNQAAGFYKAYYKTTLKTSIVYSATPKASHEFNRVYTIYAQVKFPADAATTPANGAYWKDSGVIKWRDTNGNDWLESEVIAELNGKTPKFDLAQDDANSRAKFYGAGTSSTPTEAAGATSANNVNAKQLETIGTEMEIGYFGYYVEGENGNESVDSTATRVDTDVNGDFKVVVHA